jgi:hypothetical protein
MTNTTQTLVNISTAVRKGDGWERATTSLLGRFCTEALVDAAQAALSSLTTSERERFASSFSGWVTWTRDAAVRALCAWAHAMRLREWGAAFEASIAAAKAELPAALEALGAVL